MICCALENVWIIPVTDADLPEGEDSVSWFQEFLGKTWEKLNRPCSQKVLDQTFAYLGSKEKALNPEEYVLLQIGQEKTGQQMLRTAEQWAGQNIKKKNRNIIRERTVLSAILLSVVKIGCLSALWMV